MSVNHPSIVFSESDGRGHALGRAGALHRLVATSATVHPAVARVTLGVIMLPHALQKTLGVCGGQGFSASYEGFVQKGIPGPLAVLVIVGELVGALSLLFGAVTRVGAAIITAIMLGAIFIVHLPNGFFMNWMGTQAGEGFEYHLLAIGLAVVSLLAGGGAASIDRALMKWRPIERAA